MEGPLPLLIRNLHERHPGVTLVVGAYYAEGASVCLDRHHESPTNIKINLHEEFRTTVIEWPPLTDSVREAWGNADDATRDGAYAVSLAAVELREGLVAIGRAETRSGADYYVAPRGTPEGEFEHAYRLEVSGVDHGGESVIARRVLLKEEQTRKGKSNLPALAAVVGFKSALVVLSYVKDQ